MSSVEKEMKRMLAAYGDRRNFRHTKKGPGRKHLQGSGSGRGVTDVRRGNVAKRMVVRSISGMAYAD